MSAALPICEAHVCVADGCGGTFRSTLVPFCTSHRLMLKRSTTGLIRTAAMTACLSDDAETASYAKAQFQGYVTMALNEINSISGARHGQA